jgi:hypothetical protein
MWRDRMSHPTVHHTPSALAQGRQHRISPHSHLHVPTLSGYVHWRVALGLVGGVGPEPQLQQCRAHVVCGGGRGRGDVQQGVAVVVHWAVSALLLFGPAHTWLDGFYDCMIAQTLPGLFWGEAMKRNSMEPNTVFAIHPGGRRPCAPWTAVLRGVLHIATRA